LKIFVRAKHTKTLGKCVDGFQGQASLQIRKGITYKKDITKSL